MLFYQSYVADGMANSVDPDQTATLHLSVQKLGIITVLNPLGGGIGDLGIGDGFNWIATEPASCSLVGTKEGLLEYMSPVTTKPVFGVCDQVRLNLTSATETS